MENRRVNEQILKEGNEEQIFLELKRCNGFDVLEDGMTYEAFLEQKREIVRMLSNNKKMPSSIYEVGCGSGANLFLLEQDGIRVGGLDYSNALIDTAREILKAKDIVCSEAIELSTEVQYDAVLSNSVFSYFSNLEYAQSVLEKMYQKTSYAIGLIDIHNAEKEEEFITYRKEIIPHYEEKYKNLPKLFYQKDFFEVFAKEHNMDICFTSSQMKGYWNNRYVFNCYMYKK